MKHKLEYILFLALENLFFLLPFSIAQKVGKFFGQLAFYLISSRRKIAIENLTNAFPEKNKNEIEQIAKKSFENFSISFAEMFSLQKFSKKDFLEFVNFENIDELKKKLENKSAIILSAHFGNWELFAIALGVFLERNINVIAKKQSNKFVDEKISQMRTQFGNSLIPMNNAVRETIKCLQEKKIVALLSDQSAPKESVYVNFFGKPVATFSGASAFALKTNSPLILVFILREKNRHKIIWEEISFEPNYTDENVKLLTQEHTTRLENFISKHPNDWLWMHRRWKNVQ